MLVSACCLLLAACCSLLSARLCLLLAALFPLSTLRSLRAAFFALQLQLQLTWRNLTAKYCKLTAICWCQIPTVEGASITVTIDRRGVLLNGVARVSTADVECTNGVAQVIDTVITPPAPSGGGGH